jgi:hypothetical protein
VHVEAGESDIRVVGLTDAGRGERKKEERAARRSELRPGDEFRPYDLFDEVGVVPTELLRCPILTSSEKLCWIVIARRLGRQGKAFPSYDTIAIDLGVDRRQAIRLVSGLEQKHFLRLIVKHAAAGDRDSNEYRMLWHEAFMVTLGSDKTSPRVVTNCHHPVVTNCHPNSHHHQKRNIEKRKEQGSEMAARKPAQSAKPKTGRTKPFFKSLSDDDEEKTKREPPENPEDELRQRFRERFADDSGAILQTVVADLGFDRQALADFVAFDDAHTGAPERLNNPGGYYRALVKQFRVARSARIDAENRERYRAYEQALCAPGPEEHPVCEFGLCGGGGELFENGKYRPCDCAAGQALSPKVREMMDVLNRGAA